MAPWPALERLFQCVEIASQVWDENIAVQVWVLSRIIRFRGPPLFVCVFDSCAVCGRPANDMVGPRRACQAGLDVAYKFILI